MPILSRLDRNGLSASPDVRAVHATAEALQVREIRLFRIAYARWFGEEAAESIIEPPFMRYLFAQQAPVWVRHFAREVLNRLEAGQLDPLDYGLPPRHQPPPGALYLERALRNLLVAAWIAMIGVILVGVF